MDERLQHILEHPEMRQLEGRLEETLRNPQFVIQSLTDRAAELSYRFYLDERGRQVALRCGKVCSGRCVRRNCLSDE